MIINWTGQIENDFYALGHPSVPVYLMDGENPALFDAGFTGLAELYLREIKNVLGTRTPVYLFLTHAHWDHVGSAGVFKRAWPNLKIIASQETKNLLSKPSVIHRITQLNREGLTSLREWKVNPLYEKPFLPFEIDEVLSQERPFRVGRDIVVTGISSPGHTRDFSVYVIPEKKLMIASEAVGCNEVPEFLVDYNAYLKGIKLFMAMNPKILCTGHMLVLTGEDVQPYLKEALKIARTFQHLVKKSLMEGKAEDEIVVEIKKREWDPKPFPKQPLRTYLMNTKQRVKLLKKSLRNNNKHLKKQLDRRD